MEKILVIINDVPTFYIEATLDTTIKNIKLTLENYLNSNKLDINKYNVQTQSEHRSHRDYEFVFNINRDTQVPVFFTKQYDNVTLESVFNQMKNPEIKITSKQEKVTKEQTTKFNKQRLQFTGMKDIDWLIINSLDDDSLVSLCATNKYLRSLCNETFWEKRVRERLDDYAIRIKDTNMTWKEYYLKTIKNKFNIYQDMTRRGRQLYIGEYPVNRKDILIYRHVEKPKVSSKVPRYYFMMDIKGNLLSKLYSSEAQVRNFHRDNLDKFKGLGSVFYHFMDDAETIENLK